MQLVSIARQHNGKGLDIIYQSLQVTNIKERVYIVSVQSVQRSTSDYFALIKDYVDTTIAANLQQLCVAT